MDAMALRAKLGTAMIARLSKIATTDTGLLCCLRNEAMLALSEKIMRRKAASIVSAAQPIGRIHDPAGTLRNGVACITSHTMLRQGKMRGR